MSAIFGSLSAKIFGGLSVALLIALGVLWLSLGATRGKLDACRDNFAKFRADVEARTELARISDAANKARVERDQERERSENDAEIRRRIDAAVAAVRARSVRGNTQAGDGGRGRAPVSRPAEPAGSPDGAGAAPVFSPNDLEICATNTVLAEGWQDWWKSVQEIER